MARIWLGPVEIRIAAAVIALAVGGPPATAQSVQTGVNVVVADWLPQWDAEAGGGWGLGRAGAAPGKWAVWSAETTAAVPPGTYDLFWVQDEGHADWPMRVLTDIVVAAGEVTEARVALGVALEVADWVPPLDGPDAYWGAMLVNDPDFGLVNWTFGGDAMVLPPGEYDFYWDDDGTDDHPAIWIDTLLVEEPFGGVGLEVREEDGRILIVRPLPGGPAEAAGVLAGEIIVAVDGTPVEGAPLDFAVARLRGAPESRVVVSLASPATGAVRDVEITRNRVEPDRVLHVTGGVQPVLDPSIRPEDLKEGTWGAAFAGTRQTSW